MFTRYALAIALLSSSLPALAANPTLSVAPAASNSLQAQLINTQLSPRFSNLNLNRQQTDRLSQVRRDRRTQINDVLNPRQQRQFREARRNGQSRQEALADLNLTPNQQSRLNSIKDSYQTDLNNILDSSQLQRLLGVNGQGFDFLDDLF